MRRLATAATIAALAITAISPARAAEFMLIAAEGEKPDRNVHYLAIDLISTTIDFGNYDPEEAIKNGDGKEYLAERAIASAWIIQVLENPKDPDTIWYKVQIKCSQRLAQITEAVAVHRDARAETIGSDTWVPIPDNWLGRVHTAACDNAQVVKAIQAVKASKDYDHSARLKPLTDLGMIYAGQFPMTDFTKLSDFTWNRLWQSGQRPEYTTTKTAGELAERQKMLDQKMASLAGAAAELDTSIGNQDAERAFIGAVNQTFRTKNSRRQRLFFGMEGWTEQEIVDFWGVPTDVRDYAGTRALEYYTENDTRQVYLEQIPIQDGKGNVTGMQERQTQTGELSVCAMTMFLKQGGGKPGYRLVDYDVRNSNCKVSTLGQLVR